MICILRRVYFVQLFSKLKQNNRRSGFFEKKKSIKKVKQRFVLFCAYLICFVEPFFDFIQIKQNVCNLSES